MLNKHRAWRAILLYPMLITNFFTVIGLSIRTFCAWAFVGSFRALLLHIFHQLSKMLILMPDLGVLLCILLREPIQHNLHACKLFIKISCLCLHNWRDDSIRVLNFVMWGKWSIWQLQRGIITRIAITFEVEGLESKVDVGLDFIHPIWNCFAAC